MLAGRLQKDRDRSTGGNVCPPPRAGRAEVGVRRTGPAASSAAFGGGGGGGGDDDALARVPCPSCGRKFAMDRVAQHQAICQKIASKAPRRTFQVQRAYFEGGSAGAVIGIAAAPRGKGRGRGRGGAVDQGLVAKPMPPPPRTNWREQSRALKEAIRAARAYPMPTWGADAPSRRPSGPNAPVRAARSVGSTFGRPAGGFAAGARPGVPNVARQQRAEVPQRPQPRVGAANRGASGSVATPVRPSSAARRPETPVKVSANRAVSQPRPKASVQREPPFPKLDVGERKGKFGSDMQRIPASPGRPSVSSGVRPGSPQTLPPGARAMPRREAAQVRASASPVPEWGNPSAPSKYGRDCMVTPPSRRPFP
mmetsp:Transcript_63309/g.170177  ORF Transcript_63309/g.170177 Transcript_63309/m.170177 type:complete len:367 (-) Transcript_63309:9-1109(-)